MKLEEAILIYFVLFFLNFSVPTQNLFVFLFSLATSDRSNRGATNRHRLPPLPYAMLVPAGLSAELSCK